MTSDLDFDIEVVVFLHFPPSPGKIQFANRWSTATSGYFPSFPPQK